ncbi:synaptonemal complex central element protein 2 [Dromaius novaehollandiae]|uniref:synaptonemal complex central element protein 2 n=1 Tax=Dromaius novaehollandiae TaxID=8790 RepID=UPI00311F8EC3
MAPSDRPGARKEAAAAAALAAGGGPGEAAAALAVPEGKAAAYFAALAAQLGALQQRTQQLVDRVNENRKKDHALMSSFRESLLLKVSSLAEELEERVFRLYAAHNELIQAALRELQRVTESIGRGERELRHVCRTVQAAYEELCLRPEP